MAQEADTQREILDWVKKNPSRVPCLVRVNCGTFKGFSGSIVKGAPKGTPDLLGYLPGGRMLAAEVKTAAGRLSPEQTAWRVAAKAHGVLVIAPRSLAEFIAAIE